MAEIINIVTLFKPKICQECKVLKINCIDKIFKINMFDFEQFLFACEQRLQHKKVQELSRTLHYGKIIIII